MSNMMAVLLQSLAARLGIVTGHDLAQACRAEYLRPVNVTLWLLAEVAIAACDLAEVLGTVIALNLLFGLPLLWGCLVTAFDTVLLLAIQRLGIRKMEAFIFALVGTIGACFLVQIFLAQPDARALLTGFRPTLSSGALFVAIGILGATVMPHNLYLHSALVQTRRFGGDRGSQERACRYNLIDTVIALNAAFFINAAILVLSAAVFHKNTLEVASIEEAHRLLPSFLGRAAPILFGIALLCAGQSSTITGTLAGQIIMEGYLHLRIAPWLRRLVTRMLALIPAVVVIALAGDSSTQGLIVLSQVILSLQLSFAVIPLIHFTSSRKNMGSFATPWWGQILAWLTAGIIVALNAKLVLQTVRDWVEMAAESGSRIGPVPASWLVGSALYGLVGAVACLLAWVTIKPWVRPAPPWKPKPNTVRLSATRVSVIPCVSRKSGFHGGSDHDAARTLFGCDTGPGEYSGSAGGFEQGCPTGGHGTGTVGDRHVRATILQTVAPSDALDCIGHGLAHAPTDSPGLQALRRMRPNEKTPSRSNLCERVSVWVSNPCGGSSNSWFIRWRRRKRRGPSTRGTA